MIDEEFSRLFPTASPLFLEIIFPIVFFGTLMAIAWVVLFLFSRYVQHRIERWQHQLKQKGSGPQSIREITKYFFVHYGVLFIKSTRYFRVVLLVYLILFLFSNSLDIFSRHLMNSNVKVTLGGFSTSQTLGYYLVKSITFLNAACDFLWFVFFTVLVAVWVLHIFQINIELIIDRYDHKNKTTVQNMRVSARKHTLRVLLGNGVRLLVFTVATFMIIQKMGVNIAALLATAGLASVAIGLGAQSMVRDVISGFFILFEDQFAVGDFVEIGLFAGVVEKFSFRSVRLRSSEGSIVVIPNGSIQNVRNFTTDWARVDFRLLLPLFVNMKEVAALIHEESDKMYKDYSTDIIAAPDVRPMDKITELDNRTSAVRFHVFFKTKNATAKSKVEMEFNRRMLERLDKEGHLPSRDSTWK